MESDACMVCKGLPRCERAVQVVSDMKQTMFFLEDDILGNIAPLRVPISSDRPSMLERRQVST